MVEKSIKDYLSFFRSKRLRLGRRKTNDKTQANAKSAWLICSALMAVADSPVLFADTSVTAYQNIVCADGQRPRAIVRLDSGRRLKLEPELLVGNGIDDLLLDRKVLCGETVVLMTSLRIPLWYLSSEGIWDTGDWGAASPPFLNISSFYGAGLNYEGDRELFDKYKTGATRRDRLPSYCVKKVNGFEYCSSCPEDPAHPGYCPDSDQLIKNWYFKILDQRQHKPASEGKPLIVNCNAVHGTSERPIRRCEARKPLGSETFLSYRFSFDGRQSIYDFDFDAYHDRVRRYLETKMVP